MSSYCRKGRQANKQIYSYELIGLPLHAILTGRRTKMQGNAKIGLSYMLDRQTGREMH
jgi:hypothetical protein